MQQLSITYQLDKFNKLNAACMDLSDPKHDLKRAFLSKLKAKSWIFNTTKQVDADMSKGIYHARLTFCDNLLSDYKALLTQMGAAFHHELPNSI